MIDFENTWRWRYLAHEAEKALGVPAAWTLGIIYAESRGNPSVVSFDGGFGLMQLTHSSVFKGHDKQSTIDNLDDPIDDWEDPALNVCLGTELLATLRKRRLDLPAVASMYNAGSPDGVNPHPSTKNAWGFRETPGYIHSVVSAVAFFEEKLKNMTSAERIVSICKTALTNGPIGDKLRPKFYRAFVACGFNPPLTTAGDIGKIATSCAIFVRAVLHWAGRRATRPGKIGQGINNGWLEGMTFSHPSWQWAVDPKTGVRAKPTKGCVFFRDYNRQTTGMCHVGILLHEVIPDVWVTAEGGGSPGTTCRLSPSVGKNIWAKDSLNRDLIGWWRPEWLAMGPDFTEGLPDPHMDDPAEEPLPTPLRPTLRLYAGYPPPKGNGSNQGHVKTLQGVIGTDVDGMFGPNTEKAVRAFQLRHTLMVDGVVGKNTWGVVEGELAK